MSWKNGGLWMYVLSSDHSKSCPVPAGIACHSSDPRKTSEYMDVNSVLVTEDETMASTSCWEGQMSER